MGRRFVLVGLFVVWPFRQGQVMQLATANVAALVYLVVQLHAMPYRSRFDNVLALISSMLLSMLLLCSIFYRYVSLTDLPDLQARMSIEQRDDFQIATVLLTFTFIICLFGALVFAAVLLAAQLAQDRREQAAVRRLRYKGDGSVVTFPPLGPQRYHLFVSHTWAQGQDQMRIIKQRLKEMVPTCVTFLDVDDLDQGAGGEYVDKSSVILIFCATRYFESRACARELLRAIVRGKPLIAVLESEERHGALSKEEMVSLLTEPRSRAGKLTKNEHMDWVSHWELDAEMQKLDTFSHMPTSDDVTAALFAREPIEWNRFSAYQDVTLRLIADRVLRSVSPEETRPLYLQGEVETKCIVLKPPRHAPATAGLGGSTQSLQGLSEISAVRRLRGRRGSQQQQGFHLYCSPHNLGSAALVEELRVTFPDALQGLSFTAEVTQLTACDHMLVYLTSRTWTSGDTSVAFARDVACAVRSGVHLLLVHEFPSIVCEDDRDACKFDNMWNDDWTPNHLLKAGIYQQIATPLKGGAWRRAALAMLCVELSGYDGTRSPVVEVVEPEEEEKQEETPPAAPLPTLSVQQSRARSWNALKLDVSSCVTDDEAGPSSQSRRRSCVTTDDDGRRLSTATTERPSRDRPARRGSRESGRKASIDDLERTLREIGEAAASSEVEVNDVELTGAASQSRELQPAAVPRVPPARRTRRTVAPCASHRGDRPGRLMRDRTAAAAPLQLPPTTLPVPSRMSMALRSDVTHCGPTTSGENHCSRGLHSVQHIRVL